MSTNGSCYLDEISSIDLHQIKCSYYVSGFNHLKIKVPEHHIMKYLEYFLMADLAFWENYLLASGEYLINEEDCSLMEHLEINKRNLVSLLLF